MATTAPDASVAVQTNLIENPGFEVLLENGLPASWTRDMWHWDEGVSELTVTNGSYAGANAASIRNLGENDARFQQTVAVEPDSYYEISCRVRVSGCDEAEIGANLSFLNTFISSEDLCETEGLWQTLTVLGKTGPDQTELVVMARLGGYGSLNVGEAMFDDFTMFKLTEAPEDLDVYDLSTLPPSSDNGSDDLDGETTLPWDLFGILAIAIAYLGIASGVLWYAIRRPKPLMGEQDGDGGKLAVCMAIALGVRLVIAVISRGYKVDMDCFTGWAARMAATGPASFYTKDAFCDYPPGYIYILGLAGQLMQLLRIPASSPLSWLIIKLAPICADMVMVYIVYRVARINLDKTVAFAIAVMLAFNPLTALDSAAWGQADMVLTLLIALSMIEAAKGRFYASLPLFAVAVLVKPQALMFAPLGLVVLVVEIVESEGKGKCALKLLLYLLLSLALYALLAFPFLRVLDPRLLTAETSFTLFGRPASVTVPEWLRPLVWLCKQYTGTVAYYDNMTVNACNLYQLFGMNWVPLDSTPGVATLSWILMGCAYVYAGFLYYKAKDRGKLFLVAATLITLVYVFAPMMHERYLFPVTVLLLLAYAFDRDVRLLIAFVLLSATQFANVALVLRSEHLVDADNVLHMAISALNVLGAALLGWTGWEMCVSGHVIELPRRDHVAESGEASALGNRVIADRLTKVRDWRLNLRRQDYILMLIVTALYAVVAFTNLGSMLSPQTAWRSTASGEQVTFDLGAPSDFHMTYYGGICSSTFTVQFSEDGEVWSEAHYAKYDAGEVFRWLWYTDGERDEDGEFYALEPGYPMRRARYIRVTAERAGLILHEIAFLDETGSILPIRSVYGVGGATDASCDPALLIDEQDTVPPYPSYYNSTYFDEIYHARTAYEHQQGLHALEYTHPPLGKLIIMIGINLFGMTPFGWRCMGALFGVMMLPVMYLLAKQLFRRRSLAFVAMFLLSVDLMHFTQTRIATIDVFVVFFIMLMYLFMFRYAQMSFFHTRLSRTLVPLGLCGLSMGLAIACKWTGIYGAVGLAVIFFWTIFQRLREYQYAKRHYRALEADQRRISQRAIKQFWKNTGVTILFCLLFFIAIPAVIYYFSYYWHLAPDGGLSVGAVVDMQKSMFDYHASIQRGTHGFESMWYEWPFIVKPMWYFSGTEFIQPGYISSISCMGNPAVWWFGALSIFLVCARVFTKARSDKRSLLVLIGFLSQYLPWVLVPRSMFIYHYFTSVPFIILASVLVLDMIRRARPRAYKWVAIALCIAAFLLFVMFYPIASGLPVPRAYAQYLRWFRWINF